MDNPVVSIITPIYNTGAFIIKSLECTKRQTFQNFEHIIIDDCSKDNSVQLVEAWIAANNYKCTFIRNTENKGVSKTLNTGIRLAKGKYIKGLADDEWTDDFLEKRVAHFEKQDASVGATYSDVKIIDEQSNVYAESYYKYRNQYDIVEKQYSFPYPDILNIGHRIVAPSVMTRRSIYDTVGLYDENLIAEDVDMWFRIARGKFKFAYFPESLVYYRTRKASLGNSPIYKPRLIQEWLIVYEKHMNEPELSKRMRRKYRKMAVMNYYKGKDRNSHWFLNSFKLNKDFKSLCYYTLCVLKINPEFAGKIKRLVIKSEEE